MGLPDTAVESRLDEAEELLPFIEGESMEDRKKRFNERYKEWIAEEHAAFKEYGIWNETIRGW